MRKARNPFLFTGILLVVVLAIMALAAACGDDDDDNGAPTAAPTGDETGTPAATGEPTEEPSGDPIKIGAVYPSTGRFASFFPFLDAAVQAAIQKINEEGGILGRPVELRFEDDQSEGPQAVIAARAVASDEDVVAMTPTGTVAFLALNPIGDDLAIPMVVNSSAALLEDDFEFSQWMYRVSLRETPEAVAQMLEMVVADSGATTAARIYDTGNESQVAGTEAAAGAFELVGLEEVSEQTFRAGDVDFSAQLTNLIQADPDIVYLSGTSDEISLIIEQATDRDFLPIWVGAGGMADQSIFEQSGGATVGAVAMAQWDPTLETPESEEFKQRFAEFDEDGVGPISQSAVIYDVILLIADAVERAGTTDREAVNQAIGETQDFPGVSGPITFNGPGDTEDPVPQVIIMNEEGAFVTYTSDRFTELNEDRLP